MTKMMTKRVASSTHYIHTSTHHTPYTHYTNITIANCTPHMTHYSITTTTNGRDLRTRGGRKSKRKSNRRYQMALGHKWDKTCCCICFLGGQLFRGAYLLSTFMNESIAYESIFLSAKEGRNAVYGCKNMARK